MKLKHLFAWFVAIFALTTVFTSCSSNDDEDDTVTTSVPDEMIGTWKFSGETLEEFTGVTLELGKNGKGSITTYIYYDEDENSSASLSRRTIMEYKLFKYTYKPGSKTLNATSLTDQTTFTIRNMFVENNKLNMTITLNDTEQVLSGGTREDDDE